MPPGTHVPQNTAFTDAVKKGASLDAAHPTVGTRHLALLLEVQAIQLPLQDVPLRNPTADVLFLAHDVLRLPLDVAKAHGRRLRSAAFSFFKQFSRSCWNLAF